MKAKGKGSLPPKVGSNQGNTPDPNVSQGLKGNKKNMVAPKSTGGTGARGPASPL